VDRPTVMVYERNADEWARRRSTPADDLGARLRNLVGTGPVLDAGCGSGRYFEQLGSPTVGLDAAAALVAIARRHLVQAPGARRAPALLQGDLERLPFATGTFGGVFARHSYVHLPPDRAPQAFAEAARVLVPGGTILVSMVAGTYAGRALPGDDFPGRWFSLWSPDGLGGALRGAGFAGVDVAVTTSPYGTDVVATAVRAAGC
jgi:SAM-dependent methyltransferase